MKRHDCGGTIRDGVAVIGGYEIEAAVCNRCGESQPDVVQSQLVLAHARFRKEGDPQEGTMTTVGKGSFAIRVPIEIVRSYLAQAGERLLLVSARPGYVEIRMNPVADKIRPLRPRVAAVTRSATSGVRAKLPRRTTRPRSAGPRG